MIARNTLLIEEPAAPIKYSSLFELLLSRVKNHPKRLLYTFLGEGENEETSLTYEGLDLQARRIGALLQSIGATGKRAIVLYPPGMELMTGYWGSQYAGNIYVSTFPPDPARLSETLPQFLAVVRDSQASIVLTNSAILGMSETLFQFAPELKSLQWIATDAIPAGTEQDWKHPNPSQEDLAFFQYTSGSTGNPKGVILSQRNILTQSILACQVNELSLDDVIVNWIPLYHNLGIGTAFQPIVSGGSAILMSPLSFLERPIRWLQAISRYKAKFSLGPDFAYELCVQHTTPEERASLDLSRWELAVCGAELIRKQTIDRFVEAFSPYGFRREAFRPGYGLTEATLVVSYQMKKRLPTVKTVQCKALQQHHVVSISPGEEKSESFVGCGQALPDHKILIVNPELLTVCSPDEVGEIWVSGPGVAKGYWNKPNETEDTFKGYVSTTGEGPFLRTGDLGFFQDNELFITGRLKDLIIIRGRNHYPQDIEATMQKTHPALRAGCGAAFSIVVENKERLVVVQEVESTQPFNPEEVIQKIREAISKIHNLQVCAVVLLKPGTIPKTRNIKIQRYSCKIRFLNGDLDRISEWKELPGAKKEPLPALEASKLPETEEDIDTWLVSKISSTLGMDLHEINQDKPLTSYGLDSLSAVELSRDIEESLGVRLLIANLFESPSIRELGKELQSLKSSGVQKGESTQIDLEAEAVLDPTISFAKTAVSPEKEPASIFLTGATGFLGAYFLHELLQKTKANVFCLVRAPNEVQGLNRIRQNLEFFSLWNEDLASRVIPILGDLSQPLLGLSPQAFQSLAGKIDLIYHNGASVNFIYSYRDLKATNVLGTQEVIRLAGQVKLKPVHYISTLSVFPLEGNPEGKAFHEEDPLVYRPGLMNGYAESKWVAEKLMTTARSKGLPVVIYRVGEVIGHSKTGICRAANDAYSNMIKGVILLGSAPEMNANLYLVPVDYVAQSIYRLSRKKTSLGRCFHITPEPIKGNELLELMTSFGYTLQRLPYEEWLQRTFDFTKDIHKNPLSAFMPFLKSPTITHLAHANSQLHLDYRNTREGLTDSSISCPPVRQLMKTYLSYLKHSGFLPEKPQH
jgi:thioester reductase-like protein